MSDWAIAGVLNTPESSATMSGPAEARAARYEQRGRPCGLPWLTIGNGDSAANTRMGARSSRCRANDFQGVFGNSAQPGRRENVVCHAPTVANEHTEDSTDFWI